MNSLDLVILILCGLMVGWGAISGFINIVFNLLALIVAFLAGSRLGPRVGGMIIQSDDLVGVQVILGFFLVFLAVFIICSVAAGWIERVIGGVPFFSGWLDRLGGAALGLLVGILLSLGVLVGLKQLEHDVVDEAISDSPFASFVVDNFGFVVRVARLVPEDWNVETDDRLGKLTEGLKQTPTYATIQGSNGSLGPIRGQLPSRVQLDW